jgi:hypothetical protein
MGTKFAYTMTEEYVCTTIVMCVTVWKYIVQVVTCHVHDAHHASVVLTAAKIEHGFILNWKQMEIHEKN